VHSSAWSQSLQKVVPNQGDLLETSGPKRVLTLTLWELSQQPASYFKALAAERGVRGRAQIRERSKMELFSI
jgi:hypothetical protein